VAPAITSATSTTFTAGTAGSFTVTATGYPAPTFSETGALPSGVTLSTAGLLSGTPAANSGGTYNFTITAANGTTNANQSFTLTVNQAPAITSATSSTFSVGAAGSFTVTATGYPAPAFSETGALPTGVTLSSAGVLSGTPAAGTGAAYPITITASNGIGTSATQSFTLNVNQAPAFTGGSGVSMNVGTSNAYLIFASGFPSPTVTQTSGTLPSGVTFVSGSPHGTLSGDPATGTGGLYYPVFTASNGVSPDATLNYTLTINEAPKVTSAASATFIVGTNGSFTVTSSGYPAGTYSESGALPTGVTLNSTTGVLSGTPAAGTAGSYPIVIDATNFRGGNTQNFTLTVNQPPSITSAASATFPAGSPGTFTVTTTGNPTAALSETGALPSGITFTDNGNGTATIAASQTAPSGIHTFTVIANNGVSPNASQFFTLTISQYTAVVTLNAIPYTENRGTSVTLTANFSGGTPAPTQPMYFYAGSTLLGTAVISGASPYTATLTTASLPAGAQSIVATYNGDNNYTAASSAPQPIFVIANDIWIGDGNSTTAAFWATGVPYLSTPEASGGTGVAIDSSGNVWSLNASAGSLSEFTNTGTVTNADITGGGLSTPTSLAIDGAGQIWITNTTNSISVFASNGTPVSTTAYTGGLLNAPSSVSIDISGNLWIANSGSNSVTEVLGAAAPTIAPVASGVANNTPATKP
jgi:large repetitive protein